MSDYAATPVQPILQGLVTPFGVDGFSGITFFGIGVVQTGLNKPFFNGAGDYILTLDKGLPGDVAINPDFARTQITIRPFIPGTPTNVVTKAVNYIVNPTPGVGCDKIEILLADSAGVGTDAIFEIIVRRADAGVELVNANLIGPLFPTH